MTYAHLYAIFLDSLEYLEVLEILEILECLVFPEFLD